MGTRVTWVGLTVLYLIFFGWYTSFEGPLSEEEIAYYTELFENREPPLPPERLEMIRKFMEEDTGDDFVMINVIDMYEEPLQIEGVEPGESSDEVLGKYMQYMNPAMFSRASHPVLYGQAASTAMDLMNAEGMEEWTQGAGIRYRSRRDMLEISTNPAFAGSHAFKVAAMRKTIAFPVDPWLSLGDPRLVLLLFFLVIGLTVSWLGERRREH